MPEKSIFARLKSVRRYRKEKESDEELGVITPETAKLYDYDVQRVESLGPAKVVQMIGYEFSRRHELCCTLTHEEAVAALDYLSDEYRNSHLTATWLIDQANGCPPDSAIYNKNLASAWQHLRRAYRSVRTSMKISPDVTAIRSAAAPGQSYQQILAELDDLREDLQTMTEFPARYEKLIPLHRKLGQAQTAEDFGLETATLEEIRNVLANRKIG